MAGPVREAEQWFVHDGLPCFVDDIRADRHARLGARVAYRELRRTAA